MRGMVFSLDIIIGISVLIVVLTSSYYLFSVPEVHEEIEYEQMNLLSNDFLNSMAEIKVFEAANQSETINNMITNNNLTEDELELSVLDLVLTYWGIYKDENDLLKKEIAENITEEIINSISILDNLEFSLIIGNDLITGNHSNSSESLSVSSLIENTYGSGPKYGYIARAYLSGIKTNKSRYLYFGGFVGQGNLNFNLNIPETAGEIMSAYIEVYSGSNFSLYINGNFSGNFSPDNTTGNFSANIKSADINLSNFIKGNNTIEINFNSANITEQYLGGGFLKVDYNSTELYEEKESGKMKYYFPGIKGIMNLYDGFYVNGDLNNISVYLHYYNNITGSVFYLTIANATIFESNNTGEINITLNNSDINSSVTSAGLSYTNISKTTIPLRFGIRSIDFMEQETGNADIVLITDVSGSMAYCVENNSDCSSGNQRIDLAKQLDKEFIEIILNTTGNRIGLADYRDKVESSHSLSTNKTSLFEQIDKYEAEKGTCICCGLNEAYEMLEPPKSNSSRQRFVVIMTDGIPSHKCADSGCEGIKTKGVFKGDCYGCTYCCPADPDTGSNCDCPTSQSCGECGCYSWSGWWCHIHPTCCEHTCSCTCESCCQQSCKCSCEMQNANFSSCRLHNDLNTTVHSIGFGPIANCQMGNTTLTAIADCGNGNYYASQNSSELQEIYRNIAASIVSISYTTQKISVEGNISLTGNILYNDSYMEFFYNESKPEFDYGEFSISFEENCIDSICTLKKNPETQVLEAKVTSYSADYWTNLLVLTNSTPENITIYNLSTYGFYENLGDPFILDIPVEKISNEINSIYIFLGINETDRISGLNDSKLIYSLKVPGSVNYGDIFNSSYNAEEDAKQRLKDSIYNLTGQNISILTNTDTNVIRGIRTISDANLVKFVIGKK
ncbi:MAG: VWA domain-containing protein [Candidatus Aenigmarchaeota archaeon]|nr:VWA domain-containing protein [Candidatus Aenigmarchaeota archaeon]